MTVEFQLEGQDFVALNGGPHFKFTEAISFVVSCQTQAEVDKFWKKLSAGGKEVQCGWLKDKYGVSWQIVPTVLGELLATRIARNRDASCKPCSRWSSSTSRSSSRQPEERRKLEFRAIW